MAGRPRTAQSGQRSRSLDVPPGDESGHLAPAPLSGESDSDADSDVQSTTSSTDTGEDTAKTGVALLRRRVWHFLVNEDSAPLWLRRASVVYQMLAAAAVVALFVVDSRTSTSETAPGYYHMELTVFSVWAVEYCLRLWSCIEKKRIPDRCCSRCCIRLRFALRFPMVLEAVSLASLIADMVISSNRFRGIPSLRLLTLFRIERDFKFFRPVLAVVWEKRQLLAAAMGIASIVMMVTSVSMFYIESEVENTMFTSVLMSMWWATTALTTVGYGDIVPETWAGRLLGSITAFVGVGMFALPAGIIASGFQDKFEHEKLGHLSMHDFVAQRLDEMERRFDKRQAAFEKRAAARGARLEERMSRLVDKLEALHSNASPLGSGGLQAGDEAERLPLLCPSCGYRSRAPAPASYWC